MKSRRPNEKLGSILIHWKLKTLQPCTSSLTGEKEDKMPAVHSDGAEVPAQEKASYRVTAVQTKRGLPKTPTPPFPPSPLVPLLQQVSSY